MSKTRSARIVSPLIIKAKSSRAVSDALLREKLRKQKLKAIADSYKPNDPCAHIRSVGNGV